jgi:hypothetical protein
MGEAVGVLRFSLLKSVFVQSTGRGIVVLIEPNRAEYVSIAIRRPQAFRGSLRQARKDRAESSHFDMDELLDSYDRIFAPARAARADL